MPAHLRPRESRARPVAALAIALGAAMVVLSIFQVGRRDGTTRLVRRADDVSTAPTVLGAVIVTTAPLPESSPASAATFTVPQPTPDRSRRRTPTTSGPSIGPPVSVTSPIPPRTTTTTAPPTTTTTDGTTTTTAPPTTTTTETPTTTTEPATTTPTEPPPEG